MKTLTLPLLLLLLGLGLAACDGGAETGGGEPTAAELGSLGARIHNEPERTDEILAEAGLTREELEARVREVMTEPEEARQYANAFRAATEASAAATASPEEPAGG
jgi:hypothetical protein